MEYSARAADLRRLELAQLANASAARGRKHSSSQRSCLRPHYYECLNAETAAFHEFVGNLGAILMGFRNNAFRELALEANGDLDTDQLLGGPARQFGEATTSTH